MLAVCADAKYLRIYFLKLVVVRTERRDLVSSASCERKDVEREQDMLLAFELAECHLVAAVCGHGEIRRWLPYFCCHVQSPVVGMGKVWQAL